MASSSLNARQSAIICNQYKKAVSTPNEHIMFMMSPAIDEWYILLHNIEGDIGEYIGGEYLCKLKFPADFPYKPPEFYFMTPTGIYEINRKVCIHIGEFHSNQYAKTMGASGFANNLVSGLIGWRELEKSGGIGILNTTADEKKILARSSVEYNQKFPEYKMVKDKYAEYSKAFTK